MAIKQTNNYEKLFNIIFHMLPLINSGTSEKCFGVVCIPDNYSKSVPPFQKDSVLNIDVDFLQIKILNINDFQSSVTLLLKLWLSWNEPRLIIHPTANELILENLTYIPLTNNLMDLIWLPDAHIHNFRSIKRRSLLSDFELLSVVDKTKMVYIGELEVVIYCPMSFESYPLDSHTCSFEVSSFGYSSNYVAFKTKNVKSSDQKLSQLDYYVNISTLPDRKTLNLEKPRPEEYGEFFRAVAGFEIRLQRKFKKYIFYHYIPSTVLALIANISFLIPPEIVPGRMALLITLLLCLINIFNSVTSNSPNSDSITSIGAWIIYCILFVKGALLQYGGILFWKCVANNDYYEENYVKSCLKTIDLCSLAVSLISFLLFSFMFWIHCSVLSQEESTLF